MPRLKGPPLPGVSNGDLTYCIGWLWYLSCEFWYFLLTPIFVSYISRSDFGRKISYVFAGLMIAGQITGLLWLGEYCKLYFSSYIFQGNDNYMHVSEVQPEECIRL